MPADLNRVTLIGRLTRDPELRHSRSGDAIASLRIAVNSRARGDGGEWTDKPNFFDVSVFGRQAETVSNYMAKGRRIGIDGRLQWREWETQDGSKRQSVEVVANDGRDPRVLWLVLGDERVREAASLGAAARLVDLRGLGGGAALEFAWAGADDVSDLVDGAPLTAHVGQLSAQRADHALVVVGDHQGDVPDRSLRALRRLSSADHESVLSETAGRTSRISFSPFSVMPRATRMGSLLAPSRMTGT